MKFVSIPLALFMAAASGAAFANYVDIYGDTSATGKIFDRPDVLGTTVVTGSQVAYEVFSLTVSEQGDYGFYGGFSGNVTYHNFLFVYSGDFNPAAPLTNFIVGSDDYVGYNTAYVNIPLLADTRYSLVYTGFDTAAQGPYYGNVDGPGTITLAAVSPVPEPASIAMFFSGVGLIAAKATRRRTRSESSAAS